MGDLSKLSSELAELDGLIGEIDNQIQALRRQKHELYQKKNAIERKIELKSTVDLDSLVEQWDTDTFEWSSEAQRILNDTFHMETFRPLQKAAVNAVMKKEDAIVILSTGGGKSLCYQLPAMLTKGLTLVVTPLVSLVEDQIIQLRKLGIDASSLNANTAKEEAKRVEEAITNSDSKFRLLYVTPEKLAKSKRMMNKLEKSLAVGFLKLIAIDEVHCCSQWGHDFRTDYKFLNVLKRQFKGVPILGLTATATASVLDDVKEMLGIQAALVFRAGFNRQNLKYEVINKTGSEECIVNDIAYIIKRRYEGKSGIVYCLSRNDCEKVASALKKQSISAKHYHAYMEPADRSRCHEQWLRGKVQVIVATVAFGMGIDKPDVRFVIHHSIPKSIENYYQESGRAGRDGLPAACILFYRLADVFKQSTMIQSERTGLANLYNVVRYATDKSCRRVRLAEHFEEQWETSWCQKMCDNCEKGGGLAEQLDVSGVAKMAVEIIEGQEGKITGNKLVELLSKKNRDREFCEQAVTFLLLEGYLQEEFHYTVYSVISYVGVGAKWRCYDGKSAIRMESSRRRSEDGEPGASSSGAHKNAPKSRKRKAVISSDEEEEEDDDIVVLD